jgi:tryptophan-rich sensory protein
MGSSFDRVDWTFLIAIAVAIAIAFFSNQAKDHQRLYRSIIKKGRASYPPSWIYPVVWFILWIAATAAIFIYYKLGDPESNYYVSILSIFIAHLVLAWMWTPLFFWKRYYGYALFDLVLMWLTCAALVGLTGYQANVVNSIIWASFALFVVYLLWLTYALYLNYCVWRNRLEIEKEFKHQTTVVAVQRTSVTYTE